MALSSKKKTSRFLAVLELMTPGTTWKTGRFLIYKPSIHNDILWISGASMARWDINPVTREVRWLSSDED